MIFKSSTRVFPPILNMQKQMSRTERVTSWHWWMRREMASQRQQWLGWSTDAAWAKRSTWWRDSSTQASTLECSWHTSEQRNVEWKNGRLTSESSHFRFSLICLPPTCLSAPPSFNPLVPCFVCPVIHASVLAWSFHSSIFYLTLAVFAVAWKQQKKKWRVKRSCCCDKQGSGVVRFLLPSLWSWNRWWTNSQTSRHHRQITAVEMCVQCSPRVYC